uniref:OCIA domain containing 2 n=1 Tax=Neogobius melanostomus TaxID=47308 RepID=A0A8C6U7A1_9GOBI
MSSEATGETVTVRTEGAAAAGTTPAPDKTKGSFKCPLSDHHVHSEDVGKVWKECQEESFWYRALPISLGSMAVTGGLIYNGVWKPSPRFGPFPKVIVAGILGYAIGKVSYMGTCRGKFQELGIKAGPGVPWGAGGPSFRPWGSRPGHRPCGHVCEECKKRKLQLQQ